MNDTKEPPELRSAVIELSAEDIRQARLPLERAMGLFPPECIGGATEGERARDSVEILYGPGLSLASDIVGDLKLFRRREWLGGFFKLHSLAAGDRVVLEQTGSHRFKVYPAHD